VDKLDAIFSPQSLAVVGASTTPGKVGHDIFVNILKGGYQGVLYPVNPGANAVASVKAYPTIADIPDDLDMAMIIVPPKGAVQAVKDAIAKGVKGIVIVSAGFKEVGPEGAAIEKQIVALCRDGGVRLVGPNCLGVINPLGNVRLNASFSGRMPKAGNVSFISQSGAICTAISDLSIKENIGFSYFVSLGDMLDVDFGDMIDYLGGQAEVSSIVMYVESLTHFRKFTSAARAVSRVKPIVALKAGRTPAGALAAASHTGALAGEDAVYDAAFQRAGILRVKTFEELFDCAELLAKQPKPAGPGLAIVTSAGGPGVMAADALADWGCEPAVLSAETFAKLDAILPPFWSKGNPIDMLGEATPQLYCRVVEICLDAREINGLLIMSAPQALADTAEVAEALECPILTTRQGGGVFDS
jgi:acetyltransferase